MDRWAGKLILFSKKHAEHRSIVKDQRHKITRIVIYTDIRISNAIYITKNKKNLIKT